MFVKMDLLVLFMCMLTLCNCIDDEWSLYEKSFKSANREEIFVANATTNSNFKSHFSVEKWKTLSVGRTCYTGGITNQSHLVILYSTVSENGTEKIIIPKIFDLHVPISDFEFFHERKNGKDNISLTINDPVNKRILWYTMDSHRLDKIGDWLFDKEVRHISLNRMEDKNMFFAITTNSLGKHYVDIYEFTLNPLERRFYQLIPLSYAATSLCLNTIDLTFYLSIPQTPLGQLQIYQLSQPHFFTPYHNISAPNIDQVVSFENGFKSFIAFNGLEAGIFEFTQDGLRRERIQNSNLEGIQFWLPIPVNTYRDETILLCQRKLDHETHFSFDVDVVTYNGNRFEEHEDIPCSLYGEKQDGLKCLTEYNQKTGISGASYIAIADYLSLIIPVTNSTSLLFDLDVGIRKVDHPAKKQFDEYLELKKMIEALMEKQMKEYQLITEQRKKILSKNANFEKKFQPDSLLKANKPTATSQSKILDLRDEIEQVAANIQDLINIVGNGSSFTQKVDTFNTVIFNGPVEIIGGLQSDRVDASLISDEITDDLLRDLVRKDQLGFIEGHKTFADLIVDDINFENVNGISGSSFVSNNDNEVKINGDLTFTNQVNAKNIVTTSKLINGIDIDEGWVHFGPNIKGPLEFEQLKVRHAFNTTILISKQNVEDSTTLSTISDKVNVDNNESLDIPGNVTVKTINGHNFEDFLRKLCLTSLPCHIPSLKVNGVVSCNDAQIDNLNGLKFPQGFVGLESTEEVLTISGYKEFTNTTRGYKVSTKNKVNNIDLSKIINRSDDQKLSGRITFENLEIASILQVDGNVKGEGIDKFVPNLGLNDTNILRSNVYFSNLEIQGNIFVENNFNGADFNKYLEDIIFVDEENVVINGTKTFPEGFTVLENINIDSNMINNISLSSLINKNSSQELEITTISGPVDFDQLYVKGAVDGMNISELNSTLVKISEDQTIQSELVFLEHLYTNELVFEKLNDLHQKETLSINRNNVSDETILENLEVEVLEVEGNVIGTIDNFDLRELNEDYLSISKDQAISEPYFIRQLVVDHAKFDNINNIESNTMFSYDGFKDNVTDFLLYRNPHIESFNIEGNLNIKTANEINFDQLIENNVWMKMYGNGSSKFLTVDGNVYFETLQIQNLGNADFDEFVSSLIFINETDVDIQDSIIFENGIRVEKLIETETLNNVALKNILRKDGEQTLIGPLVIFGNVTVKDELRVEKMINNVDIRFISENLDIKKNVTTIKGEVIFNRLAYIHNLIINGTINGKDFDREKSKFVYSNDDIDLEEDTFFKEMVHVKGNFGITNDINGIILSDFVSKVVWITHDADIEGPVRFTRPVVCYKSMNVDEQLNTKLLFGENLEGHVNSGVYINKGLLKGLFRFDNLAINEDLNTLFLNNINMSNIIPLKSDQELESLEVTEVSIFHDVDVGGKVNGIHLMKEVQRTALKNIPQEIPSDIVFLNHVLIENNLVTPRINDKPTSKIVTTNTNQNLTATYNFNTKSWVNGHLIIHGLINGINLTSWKNSAISTNQEKFQEIEKEWTVVNDLNLVGPVSGGGVMNGINITKLVNEVKEKYNYQCNIETGIFKDYKNLCTDVTYIYENSKNQIYKFKYFEELQKLQFSKHVNYVKYFEVQGQHYLLINEHQSCFSHLMEFRDDTFYTITEVHTGILNQAEIARDSDDMFLVTTVKGDNKSVCKITFSTVVWRFINKNVQVLTYFENQELLQESQVPLTFYGLRNEIVTEFKIDKSSAMSIRNYRKWRISEDNIAFFPRGLKTGLALRNGENIIFLNQTDPTIEDDFGFDTEAVILGTYTTQPNSIIPGRIGGDIVVTNVGVKKAKKSLLAVARHKEAKVGRRLDIIEIYQNPFTGELFDKIPTYGPSCLTSLEFENGETLLAFIEEQKHLQVYEYKGESNENIAHGKSKTLLHYTLVNKGENMKINIVQRFLKKEDGSQITQNLTVITAIVVLFTAGIHQGWAGPSLLKILSDEYPISVSEEEASYITIVGPVGHVIGGFLAMNLADSIGRKKSILSIGMPQVLSFLLIYFSYHSKYLLYIARVLGGIGEGAALALLPCYIAEVAEPSVRGKLVSSVNLSVLFGHLFINVIGSYLNIHTTAIICVTFPLLFWITFIHMPESPYYYLMKKNVQEAEKALQILRRISDVKQELQCLNADVERQMTQRGTYMDLFRIRTNRMAFMLVSATRFFQIFTGSIALTSYQQIMISQATELSPAFGSTVLIISGIVMVLITSMYVDKYGRKPLMVVSSALTAFTLLAQALFLTVRDYTTVNVTMVSWLPLLIMICNVLAFRGGLGVVTNIFMSELYSTSIKAKAISLGSLNFAMVMIVSTKMYQMTADYIGLSVPFYIFAFATFVGTLFFYFMLPETKGKRLEAIQQDLINKRKKNQNSNNNLLAGRL